MTEVEKFAKAFQLWEDGFRAEPSSFMTAEQSAEMEVSQLSTERAEYFYQLLKEVK